MQLFCLFFFYIRPDGLVSRSLDAAASRRRCFIFLPVLSGGIWRIQIDTVNILSGRLLS
jgi:hypothetical protein